MSIMKRFDKVLLMVAMILPLQMASAMAAEKKSAAPVNPLVLTKTKGSELQLEASQIPLPKILDDIAKKTHIPIHYTVLPDGLVSATCLGTNIKAILECLLAKKADLVFRNSQKPGHTDEIEEVWIMGSSLAKGAGQSPNCVAATENPHNALQTAEKPESEADRVHELLTMSQSENPEDRTEAIAALLGEDHQDDPAVKAMLEKAVTDQDPNVRAQAVSTLAQFEGDNQPWLQGALQDESVDVRLMAVGGVTADNIALLEQAANDSDETVRILAATRLAELKDSAENP